MAAHFATRIAVGRRPGETYLVEVARCSGGCGGLVPVRYLGGRLTDRLSARLPLLQACLERLPQLLAGHLDVESGPPRLELDEADVVVPLAVAPCIALGLGKRTQPHEGTVLLAGDSVKNPQTACG
jgi:hypothetical protein